jgi:predicted aspartyl protease
MWESNMGNLQVSSTSARDPRPFQVGKAEGYKNGGFVSVDIEWLVDTGATVSVVTKQIGDQFDLTPTGASASATTGGTGILMKTGLTTVFAVLDTAHTSQTANCTLDVGVKSNNNGSEILGMDQVGDVTAQVRWDPVAQDGDLYQ